MTKLNEACSICIWLWFNNEWFKHKMTNALSANCYHPPIQFNFSKSFWMTFLPLFDLRNTFHFSWRGCSFKMRVWKWVYFLGKSKMSQCVSLWQYIKVVWQMIFRLSFVCNLCLHINEKEFDFRSLTVSILESEFHLDAPWISRSSQKPKWLSRGRFGIPRLENRKNGAFFYY